MNTQYTKNELIGFAGILSTETRKGRFIKQVNEHLVLIDYGDHTELNHIKNIYKLSE